MLNFLNGVPRKVILTFEDKNNYEKLVKYLYKDYIELYNKLRENDWLDTKILEERIKSTKELIYATPEEKAKIYLKQIDNYIEEQDTKRNNYNVRLPKKDRQQINREYSAIYDNLLKTVDLCKKVADHLQYKEYLKQQKQKKGTI